LTAKSRKDILLQELKSLYNNKIVGTILLLLIVLAGNFILQGVLTLALKTDRPLYTPISGSMRPTLNIGDLLIVQGGLTGETINAASETGDIIVFLNPRNPNDLPWVHRAIDKVQINGEWYIETKGDANTNSDYIAWGWRVPENYVIGKVIVSIPVLGYALNFLDEARFSVGDHVITLRIMLIIILVTALFALEFTGPSEGEEVQAKEAADEKGEIGKGKLNH
jgi:signal peptidase I